MDFVLHIILPWIIGNAIIVCLALRTDVDRKSDQQRNRRRY